MSNSVASLQYKPLISIIMPVYNPPIEFLDKAIQSVLNQAYPFWELCIADDASPEPEVRTLLEHYTCMDSRIRLTLRSTNGHISATSNSALALATGEFVALLDHDDLLALEALYEIASLLNRHPEADMIYSDEDKIDSEGKRFNPFFKPDWCPDSFLSRMYTCHLGVYRRSIINEIGGFRLGYEGSQDYDLVLRFTEKTSRIFHIPKILYHWRSHPVSTAENANAKSYSTIAAIKALKEAVLRRGEVAREIITNPDRPGVYLIRYEIKEYKLVSIIIPTRNLGTVLDRCLKSIFEKSSYPNYEVILIDNGSNEQETLDIIRYWEVREPKRFKCHLYDIPFNYSKINNFAAQVANGDYLLFLNNDTEVITSDWIEAMVEQAQRVSTGAVGALLLYPDNTIQHAGVVLGIGGVAGHGHKYFPSNHSGYFSSVSSINNYSAVTAACLMCRREVFEEVGGFDEDLAVAFNDVDLCLKMNKKYNNIYLPNVQLYHYESKSRGLEDTSEKQKRFRGEINLMKERWAQIISHDPCYTPNLTRYREDYTLALLNNIQIVEVSAFSHVSDCLLYYCLDSPKCNSRINASCILFSGWLIPRYEYPTIVQVVHEGNIVALLPLTVERSDVAAAYSKVTSKKPYGFYGEFTLLGGFEQADMELRVLFADNSNISFIKIVLQYLS